MTWKPLQRWWICGVALMSLAAAPVPPVTPTAPVVSETPATDTPPPATNVCTAPPMRIEKKCDDAGAFLCLETPPGGVTGEKIAIRGRVDRSAPSYAGLLLSVQHDQTKQVTNVPTAELVGVDGRFTAAVQLPQLGTYTVVAQAMRIDGAPAVESAQFSRVVAPDLQGATVAVTPAPDAQGVVAADHATVTVDLLAQCERCDLIGSQTGAVTVIIENAMQQGEVARRIERRSNLGVDGVYQLCVPLSAGKNTMTARICSPNTSNEAACPTLAPVTVQARTSEVSLQVVEPADGAATVVDATRQSQLAVAFRVEGLSTEDACDAKKSPVTVQWNHSAEEPLCPQNGLYRSTQTPIVGVNLAIVRVRTADATIEQPVTFGWGKLHSAKTLHATPKLRWLPDTVSLGVSQHLLGNVVRPLLNHFLESEQFGTMLQSMMDTSAPVTAPTPEEQATDARRATIRAALPHCAGSGGPTDMRLELAEPPQVGSANVSQVQLNDHGLSLAVELRDVKVLLRYFHDANHDGQPDAKVLPLKLAFASLRLYPKIVVQPGEPPTVLLTADTTDCTYRDAKYCSGAPAVLVPQQYQGNASPLGSFVVCDLEEQHVPNADREGCKALNTVNEQTGLLSAQILEAANTMAYCSGSTLLTDLARSGLPTLNIAIPTIAGRDWTIPLQVMIDTAASQISARGIWARLATSVQRALGVGEDIDYGYLTATTPGRVPTETGALNLRDISLSVAQDMVNQALAAVAIAPDKHQQGGPLDWDIHEGTLQEWDIDLQSCGVTHPAGEVDSPLCNLRPRVAPWFGSVLSDHEYLPLEQPLLLRVRGSRILAPRLRFWTGDIAEPAVTENAPPTKRTAQMVDVTIPELEIAFFALATDPNVPRDPSGQPAILYDNTGAPVVLSLAPERVSASQGYILKTRLSMVLTLEVGAVRADSADPTQLQMPLWVVPSLSRFSFATDAKDNHTLINPTTLVGALLQKVQIGLDGFRRAPDDSGGFTLPIPKRIAWDVLGTPAGLSDVGITEMRIDPSQFDLAIDPGQAYLHVDTNISFIQRLRTKGKMQEWHVPE